MNSKIAEAIPEIVVKLQKENFSVIRATLGFDACIDNIVRVVSDIQENNETNYFNSSSQFGEYLVNLENRSCGIELRTLQSKIGGNMVITANALGNLGFKIDCLGTFGIPDILPVFRSMSSNCTLHSIGEAITTTALEFNDSKVMMFDPEPYNKLTWEDIKELTGTDFLKQIFSGKQLVSLLNWSEIKNSSRIWKGILDEILPFIDQSETRPYLFTDFSDCSRKSKKEIQYAIELLASFRNYFKIIISLNQNEANLIAKAMDVSLSNENEIFIDALFHAIHADVLTIHRLNDAFAYDGISFAMCDTFLCKEPTILTGGGDNFNAGFCFAQINGFDIFQSLLVANAVSGYYVKTGISPNIDSLINFLNDNLNMTC